MIQRFVRHGLGAALATLVLISASRAGAFCRTTTCAIENRPASCVRDADTGCWTSGAPLIWEQACVSYSIVSGGAPSIGLSAAEAEDIVASAFSLWPNVPCNDDFPSISLVRTADISCDEPEYNSSGPNANAVIFREDDWPHDPTAFALTIVSFEFDTGKMLDADMEINVFGQPLTGQSLQYVVAHEAGHFLGLDHSDDPQALMFFRYSPLATNQRPQLREDDQAGLCEIYPPDRSAVHACDPEPERGFAPDCGGDVVASCSLVAPRAHRESPSSHWLLWVVSAVACVRRRSQSRYRVASRAHIAGLPSGC